MRTDPKNRPRSDRSLVVAPICSLGAVATSAALLLAVLPPDTAVSLTDAQPLHHHVMA